jgi:Caspase domain/Calcineurin-like phosphoesterase
MPDKYALIIGNANYEDERLPSLRTPGTDARDLAEVLRAKTIGGFTRVDTLIDKPEKTLRLAIARFCSERALDDSLLLYFSGHGVKDSHGRLYFAVKDTDRDFLSATAIPAAFVTEQLNNCNSKTQILLLDCCYSGAFARAKSAVGGSVGTEANFQIPGYGRVTLTASDATEYAWEGDQVIGEVKPSIFTRYLIEGMETGEADLRGRGEISTDDLYQYANKQVLRSGSKQRPMRFADDQEGEIIIAKNPRPVAGVQAELRKPEQIQLIGKNGRCFAGTSFRVDNTSGTYYQSPYFLENRGRLQPIPPPRNPPHMDLSDVLEKSGLRAIETARTITFHAVGDTGAAREKGSQNADAVANMMVADVRAGGLRAPAFFFHLGDLIFFFAENKYYYDQFYAPFQDYDRPIFALPGNHDGMVYDPAIPTLSSFLRNFCAPRAIRAADAGEHTRSVMTQPGPYFTLDAPFVSIIGLYSNVVVGAGGVIRSGDRKTPVGDAQFKFLVAELKRLKPAREAGKRAVIVGVHHPPFVGRGPKSKPGPVSADIDQACKRAGLWPDAILSSHWHLYQRCTRTVGKRQIPYIIAGTGGYGVSPVQGSPFALPYKAHDFTVENMAVELGYLTITVDMSIDAQLIIAFNSPRLGHAIDKVTIDLLTSSVKAIQPDSPPAPETPKTARSSPPPRRGLKNASGAMRSNSPSHRSGA